MSAFIVTSKTINQIVNFIACEHTGDGPHAYACSDFLKTVAPTSVDDVIPPDVELGQRLYDLNVRAVSQRYPGESLDTLPGPIEVGYTYRGAMPPPVVQVYKSLGCLLYQCSEGDVPQTPLFKALKTLHNRLAHGIVCELPAYATATWDA